MHIELLKLLDPIESLENLLIYLEELTLCAFILCLGEHFNIAHVLLLMLLFNLKWHDSCCLGPTGVDHFELPLFIDEIGVLINNLGNIFMYICK